MPSSRHNRAWRDAPQWAVDLMTHIEGVERGITYIMSNVEQLRAAMARNTSIGASLLQMVAELKKKAAEAEQANDPAILADFVKQLDTESDAMVEAMKVNTPASNEPPPADVPPVDPQNP